MPIAAAKLRALRPDDQFLISYPRSGNTWVRYLILDVIILQRPEIPVPRHPGLLVPDIHINELDHPHQRDFSLPTRLFKSHNLADLRGRRFVYVFRDPADALVSFWHFHLRQGKVAEGAKVLDRFCQTMLGGWCNHMEMALAAREARPTDVHLVSFEMLLRDTRRELGRVTTFYGLPANEDVLFQAVERNAHGNLRAKEQAMPKKGGELFFRVGRSGSGREELSAEIMAMIGERAAPLFERAQQLAGWNQARPTLPFNKSDAGEILCGGGVPSGA